jgi:hypothetical protein
MVLSIHHVRPPEGLVVTPVQLVQQLDLNGPQWAARSSNQRWLEAARLYQDRVHNEQ